MRLRTLLLLILWMPVCAAAQPTPQGKALAEALEEMRKDDWRSAIIAVRPAGDVGRDIIEWHRLRQGGQAPFDAYRDFLARRPDWPGLDLLQTRGEGSIPEDADPSEVVAYFKGGHPVTGTGVLRLVEAYRATGAMGDAEAMAVLAWRTLTLTTETEDALLNLYPEILASHHTARMDDLLWRGQVTAVQRMMPRVPDGWKKLAEARLALAARDPGVDARIAAVPKELAADPGLAFERFDWRVRKGRSEDAISLMAERSTSLESLGRPDKWSNWRRIFPRRLMADGQGEAAYGLASRHFLIEGNDYADLEWLSGYIALRYLKDPELALVHFDHFADAVQSPISLGRAGYWRGRALAAMGDDTRANEAYREGAQHQSSYYGLLAAEAAGLPLDPTLAGTETFPPLEESPLKESSVLVAGMLLLDAGDTPLAERFLTHLAEGRPREETGTLASLLLELGEVHLALMVAKRAASESVVLPEAYFPLSPLMDRTLPIPKELALAIARRESEFDPEVVSPAGARGLMQLMPGTAQDVSRELGIEYSLAGLTGDAIYNIRLGSTYLEGLIDIFGPAPVLVSVGYNAGPGRSLDWVKRNGDPRSEEVDIIDWVELIPFRETQNYVMRVAESIVIYRARLAGKTSTEPLAFTTFLRKG